VKLPHDWRQLKARVCKVHAPRFSRLMQLRTQLLLRSMLLRRFLCLQRCLESSRTLCRSAVMRSRGVP
jgi:hypothetical protein